jgi:Ankyrin repeats (3 copies)/Ankyrin repeat
MAVSSKASKTPDLKWIEAADNPWGVRVLDLRPYTLGMLSTSTDPVCAQNAVSFGQDDGTSFIDELPPSHRNIKAQLVFPIDRILADGVLFIPRQMEQKWAIFYHREKIICVRSWLRKVQLIGSVAVHSDTVEITEIRGTFWQEGEEPGFTERLFDYLMRSHALDTAYPIPIPNGMEKDKNSVAMWSFGLFGNRALFATPYTIKRSNPDRPLRTHSLLHIAVARGDIPSIERWLNAGVPVDLLAADGLAPLHWALAFKDTSMIAVLIEHGSPIDIRSDQGATPLMNAAQAGEIIKARYLIERGADVNACDLRGFTSVHRAAELGHLDILRLLLDSGAESNPETQGFTPRALAEKRDHQDIVDMLDKYISKDLRT